MFIGDQKASAVSTEKQIKVNELGNAIHKKDSEENKELIAKQLIKESEGYANSSQSKQEKAKEHLGAANAFEKMADAVRSKAKMLRNGNVEGVKRDEAIKEVSEIVKNILNLEVPIPRDATPEKLEQIADTLEAAAKEHRRKADDLLKDSEKDFEISKNLKEQASMLQIKDMNFNDIQMKSFVAHNEGLDKVFKMLGILRLDNEYKQQIVMAEQKGREIR